MNISQKLGLILLALVAAGFAGLYVLLDIDSGLTLMLIVGGLTLVVVMVSGFVWLTMGSSWLNQAFFAGGFLHDASLNLDQARSTHAFGGDATSLFGQALDEARRALGDHDPQLLPFIYGYLDTISRSPALAKEAGDLAAEGLRIVEQSAPSPENLQLALVNAAKAFDVLGRYRTALSLWNRLIDMHERHGSDPVARMTCLVYLAHTLQSHGQPAAALEAVERAMALDSCERKLDEEARKTRDAMLLNAHNVTGASFLDLGRHHDAVDAFRRTLDIIETRDIDNVDTLRVLVTANLSVAHRYLGDLTAAAELGARARDLAQVIDDDEHSLWATLDFNDGQLRAALGDHEGALEAHMRAFESRQRLLHEDHQDLARSLVALAEVKLALGESDEAIELATKAEKRLAPLVTTDHPLIAKAQAVLDGQSSPIHPARSAYR
jgi:tetratricopeptide (TPR) repeat protein